MIKSNDNPRRTAMNNPLLQPHRYAGIYPVGSSVAAGEAHTGAASPATSTAAAGDVDELLIPLWTSHPASRWMQGQR